LPILSDHLPEGIHYPLKQLAEEIRKPVETDVTKGSNFFGINKKMKFIINIQETPDWQF
jgi:hypothetical protein